MKYFISFLIILSQSPSFSQVTIKGKILHYAGEDKVYYYATIEGIRTPYWEELYPKADGTFTIQFENEGFGTTTVSYQSVIYRFFHDADSEIYFEIDQGKIETLKECASPGSALSKDSIRQVATREISGEYQEINEFYNRQIRTAYATTRSVGGNYFSYMVYEANTPEEVNMLLDSLMQHEFEQIDRLSFQINLEAPSSDEKISEIESFLKNEVRAFYGAVFLNGIFLKRKEQVVKLIKDSTVAKNIYNRQWEQMIEDFAYEAVNDIKPDTRSPDYMDLMESLAVTLDSYQEYHAPKQTQTLDEFVVEHLINQDTSLFYTEKTAFAHSLAGVQRFLMDQLFYSPVLLHSIYQLQERHPDSKLLEHYDPWVEKLEDYLKTSQGSFKNGRIIHRNYDSFEALISRFEGKNILLDVWATWCQPCIKEFENKDKLQPFVENGQIEFLYISIDKLEWEDRWKNSIKYNQLNGYHYQADREFIVDMWKTLGGYTGAIPRYALIDKHGDIFLNTAARPSEDDKLASQINDLIHQIQN